MKKFLVFLILVLYTVDISYSQINLNSGLKAKFDFSGNANDITGNGYDGIVNGATLTTDRFGNPNSAYSFDGINQNIVIPDFGALIPGAEISLSFWVKANQVKAQGVFTLFPDDQSDRLFAGVYYGHNGVSSTFWDFGDISGPGRLGSIGTYFQSCWEHYVFISSASQNTMQIYRNGYLQFMRVGHDSIDDKNKDFCLGGNIAGGGNCFFDGDIDDVSVYDRVLNPAEIRCLFNGYDKTNVNDLRVFVTNHPNPRPGFSEYLNVVYQNLGVNLVNGYVELNYDTNYTFIQSTPPQDSIGNHYLGWNVNNLPPAGQGYFHVEVALPSIVSLGTQLSSSAIINPVVGDTTPVDNYDTLLQTVVGGYDPNYLEVLPVGDIAPSFVTNGEYLYYIIHFQNTGTADAINVRLENDMDPNLIISSVEVLGASHAYTFTLGNDNKLIFNFDNIHLPDSGASQSGSNGFVMYRVKPLPWLQLGDQILNTASIFFDFNLPVITNTVVTTVANPLAVSNFTPDYKSNVGVYPNPATSDKIFIKYLAQSDNNATIKVFDMIGKIVASDNLKVSKGVNLSSLNISELNNGLYTIEINCDGKVLRSKFLKQ